MGPLEESDLLLFVAGEPDSAGNAVRLGQVGLLARWTSLVVPASGQLGSGGFGSPGGNIAARGSERPPLTDPRPWHLPPQQMICVNMVLDAAEKQGRSVTVVDVDRPGSEQALVDRWCGPQDVLPILVRPDGARLMGVENFSPDRVRRFIGRRWTAP